MTHFFLDSQTHPLAPERRACSIPGGDGCCGCPGVPSWDIQSWALCFASSPVGRASNTRADRFGKDDPVKGKCKEHKAPDSSLLRESRNVVGSKEYKHLQRWWSQRRASLSGGLQRETMPIPNGSVAAHPCKPQQKFELLLSQFCSWQCVVFSCTAFFSFGANMGGNLISL